MPDLNKPSKKIFKKWIFLVIGIIIIVALYIWYTKTPNLFKNHPKPLVSIQATLDSKAQKAGYRIAWYGDSSDVTGRAILALGKRSQELIPDSFYWTVEKNAKLNLTGSPMGMGVFKEWIKIQNSNDYYMILNNPLSRGGETTQLGIRIIIDDATIATKTPNIQKTILNVDNLDYGNKNKNVSSSQRYGLFATIDKSTLDKIIKPGDVIAVFTIPLDETQAKAAKSLMLVDEEGIPYALSVSVRRFGGLEELKKEL